VNILINKNFLGLDDRYCLIEMFLCTHVGTHMVVQILPYAATRINIGTWSTRMWRTFTCALLQHVNPSTKLHVTLIQQYELNDVRVTTQDLRHLRFSQWYYRGFSSCGKWYSPE